MYYPRYAAWGLGSLKGTSQATVAPAQFSIMKEGAGGCGSPLSLDFKSQAALVQIPALSI